MENYPKQFVLPVASSEVAVHFPDVGLRHFSSLLLLRMICRRLKRPGPQWNDWVVQTNQSCRNTTCKTGRRIAGNKTTRASYKKNRCEAITRIDAHRILPKCSSTETAVGSPSTHAWPRICDEGKQTRGQGTGKLRARGRNKWSVDAVVDRETGKTEAGWKAACSDNRGIGPFISCPRLDDQGR